MEPRSRDSARPDRGLACFVAVVSVAILASGTLALAENIDPDNDGSQYAYGENIGWINAEPGGEGGPGLEVSDSALSGYLWGENAGWISLTCNNTSSCGTTDFGVVNDGQGVLSGYAWGENIGWISFSCENTATCAPASYGVTIDPATGAFGGRAWGENVGWITFASSGPNPFGVRTSWMSCAAPTQVPLLSADKAGGSVELSWGNVPLATGYDIVRGSLIPLISGGGDYASATEECLANNVPGDSLLFAGDPAVGQGFWFLLRGTACAAGSYDAGALLSGSRDAGIGVSGNDCP